MRTILGRKQTSTNEDWLYAVRHIEELISPQEVAEYAARAVERIRAVATGAKVAYAWSAGKDSIVLGKLCEQAGVTSCFFGHSDLEFPQYLEWAFANMPNGCEVLNVHLDLDWLAKHQDMHFIDDAFRLNKWYGLLQRSFFTEYYERHKPDCIIVGHRIIDGNTCGKDHVIRKKSGETRFAAIADWPHEAILGYIHYNGLALPPTYDWADGYVFGPTPWPIWGRPKDAADGWRMIQELYPEILPIAAEKIESARIFLEGRAGA